MPALYWAALAYLSHLGSSGLPLSPGQHWLTSLTWAALAYLSHLGSTGLPLSPGQHWLTSLTCLALGSQAPPLPQVFLGGSGAWQARFTRSQQRSELLSEDWGLLPALCPLVARA